MLTYQRTLQMLATAFLTLIISSAHGVDLRQHCKKRCNLNKVLCTGSTLPPIAGAGSSGGSCSYACVDTYSNCASECGSTPSKACLNNCNSALSSCTSSCSDATFSCNDAFLSCNKNCDSVPQCTQDAHCGSGACVASRCEPSCTSNAQCRQRMGPDALCLAPAGKKKRCVLS